GCRPFIGLDGCHLKGPFGGVFLGAIYIDTNKRLFPLAFAIVEVDGKDSWRFFLEQLYTCIGVGTQDRVLVFMSDKEFQVLENGIKYVVNLRCRCCSCDEWNIKSITCRHVETTLGYTRESMEDYCHEYFIVGQYMETYRNIIHPIPETNLNPGDICQAIYPPHLKRFHGRPKATRFKAKGEQANRKKSYCQKDIVMLSHKITFIINYFYIMHSVLIFLLLQKKRGNTKATTHVTCRSGNIRIYCNCV
ncbi:SWIM domain-containing protein/MULE domain-containing protein, partial [Cephalotus follicularis]